jgi:DNA-binding CsgD family transcriptional regulator
MTTHADLTEVFDQRIVADWALSEWADRLLEQAGLGVTIVDRHGTVMYYNKWASEHLDRQPGYLGHSVHERHRRKVTNPRFDAMLKLFVDGRIEPVRYVARPYGKTTILVTVSPIRIDGELVGLSQLVLLKDEADLADEEHFVDMMVSLATAIILDMRGDAAAAAHAAHLAVGLARKGAGILEVANALLVRAEALEHLGEHPQGQASRNEATTLLQRCTDAGIAARLLTTAQRGTGVAVSARNQACVLGEELTAKELEVLGLLATRLSRREIGQRLYVSLNTVKTHQRALYRKLGVEDRHTAVKRARELNLL